MITVREANLLIQKGVKFGKAGDTNEDRVLRLTDLQTSDRIISDNKLKKALIQAKFFNGIENFSKKDQNILVKFLNETIDRC